MASPGPHLVLAGISFMTGTLFFTKALLRDQWLNRRHLPWLNMATLFWCLAILYGVRTVAIYGGFDANPHMVHWASLAVTALGVGLFAGGWLAHRKMAVTE